MIGQQSSAAPITAGPPVEFDKTQLCDVLGYCSKQLGLQGLACLAASSKQYKEACVSATARDAAILLVDALQAAGTVAGVASTVPPSPQQPMQAVAWLLHVAPSATPVLSAASSLAAEHILRVPNVPLPIAKQLAREGVRITFSQLTAAANKMVQGVEVWVHVQAQRQRGTRTDIPDIAFALLSNSGAGLLESLEDSSRQAADDDVYGALQLAMNCSNPDVAATAAKSFIWIKYHKYHKPSLSANTKGAAAVSKLVVTAATRRHSAAVLRLATTPALLHDIDTSAHQSVLLHLIEERDITTLTALLGSHQSSIAHQLSTEATLQLLQAAVESKCSVAPLCQVPAAQQLQSHEVLQLLQAAVAEDDSGNMGCLYELPAAQHFDGDMLAQLLETAIKIGTSTNRLALLSMHSAQQLSASLITQLLQVAIEHNDEAAVAQLLGLQSTQQLTLSMLERLLEAALQQGADSYSWKLFCVPAAKQLGSCEVAGFIAAALERHKWHWAKTLCELPAAKQIPAGSVSALVLTAIQRSKECCDWLRRLPAFEQLSSDAVVELLQAAVKKGPAAGGYVGVICDSSAARQLSNQSLQQLLLAATEQHGQAVTSGFVVPLAQLAAKRTSGMSILKRMMSGMYM